MSQIATLVYGVTALFLLAVYAIFMRSELGLALTVTSAALTWVFQTIENQPLSAFGEKLVSFLFILIALIFTITFFVISFGA